jgi:hypothetical protein
VWGPQHLQHMTMSHDGYMCAHSVSIKFVVMHVVQLLMEHGATEETCVYSAG